jgi:hypothetical protein
MSSDFFDVIDLEHPQSLLKNCGLIFGAERDE